MIPSVSRRVVWGFGFCRHTECALGMGTSTLPGFVWSGWWRGS